eukprot:scaffold5889_cov62-Phaeocystis_antarctica.AAC.8
MPRALRFGDGDETRQLGIDCTPAVFAALLFEAASARQEQAEDSEAHKRRAQVLDLWRRTLLALAACAAGCKKSTAGRGSTSAAAAPAAVPAATMSRSGPRREGDMLPRGSDE